MRRLVVLAVLAGATAGCASMCGPAPAPPSPQPVAVVPATPEPPIPPMVEVGPPKTPDTDVFAMLAAQRGGTPTLQDVELAARYYCSSRAKLPQFVSRDLPPELIRKSMPSYDLVTYHCVTPPSSN